MAPGADIWLLSIVSSMEPAVGCLGMAALADAALELTGRGRWYGVAASGGPGRWQLLGSWTWEKP